MSNREYAVSQGRFNVHIPPPVEVHKELLVEKQEKVTQEWKKRKAEREQERGFKLQGHGHINSTTTLTWQRMFPCRSE